MFNSTSHRFRLTQEMAEDLVRDFKRFSVEGAVTLEVNAAGLWIVDPGSDRVRFLSSAVATAPSAEARG